MNIFRQLAHSVTSKKVVLIIIGAALTGLLVISIGYSQTPETRLFYSLPILESFPEGKKENEHYWHSIPFAHPHIRLCKPHAGDSPIKKLRVFSGNALLYDSTNPDAFAAYLKSVREKKKEPWWQNIFSE